MYMGDVFSRGLLSYPRRVSGWALATLLRNGEKNNLQATNAHTFK